MLRWLRHRVVMAPGGRLVIASLLLAASVTLFSLGGCVPRYVPFEPGPPYIPIVIPDP